MIRDTLFSVAIAAALVAVAGCATGEPELKAMGSVEVKLTDEQKTSGANVRLFDLITITLPPSKEPSYQWQISFHDVRFLKQTTEITPGASPEAGPTVSFIARAPGRTRVRFLLLPPNVGESGVDPADQQEVIFTIARP